MASGVELATAYVNILPSTSGLGKELKKYLGDVEQKSEETGKESGNRFTRAFGKWAKRGLMVGGAALGAAAGAALIGGMKSAIDQQQGQAVLSGLYGDASKAQKTLEDLKKVSSRSPLEYTAYQEAASALAYAGVEGDSAVVSLENVGKAIVAAGGDSSKLGQATGGIMKAINNGGIAMMDSLGQISESGVPILSGLAEHFGVGIDEVKKMASEGKVNITDVMSVMENATGDTFQQMLKAGDAASETFGSQWKIAKDNVQVALGGVLLPLIEKITPAIKPAGEAVERFIDGLPAAFERVSNAVRENAGLLTNLGIVVGTLVAGMLLYRGVVVATAVAQKIMAAATMAWTFATKVARIATAGWAVQQRLLNMALRANPIGIVVTVVMLLVGAFILAYKNSETFRNVVQAAWAGIKAAASAVWNWIKNTLWPGILAAWDAIAAGAVWLYENAIKPAWDGIKTVALAVWDWISGTLWPGLVDAWDAIAGGASAMYEDGVKPAWSGISDAISAVVDWVTGTAVPWLQQAWDVIGSALRWLYENIVRPVWDGIRIAIAIAATAIMVTIDLLVWVYRKVLAPVFTWLYEKVVKPVWNAIKTVIQVVVAWFRDTAWPLIKVAIDWIGAAFVWLRDKLKGVWAWIRDKVIAPVVAWFRDTVWPIFEKVIEWLGKKFEHFRIRLGIVWGLVQAAIKAVVVWFRDTAWPILRKVIDWIKQWFENLKNNLKRIWSFIKNNVINPVIAWFRDTAWPVVRSIIDKLKNAFQSLRDRLKAIWDAIKTKIIKPVVDWIVGTAWKKLDDFIGKAKSGFDNLKESVLKAWDKIKEGMKAPINGVIRIYNKHIAGNFNKVIDTIFGEEGAKKYKIGTMNEFARGGWTGPGSKYQEAGIVHADEFVIRKESQNDLARRAPGFLDSLNRYGSRALGYANGGLVKLRMPFAGSYPRGDGFGARGGKHDGIDWPMPHGAVLKAVAAGNVKHTRNPAAGKKLELTIGNGLVAGYHHLSSFIAGNGSSVGRGADVARVGSTGRSSGPHLHFSLKRDGKYVDPAPYLGAGGAAGEGGGGDSWWNPFDGLWSKIKDKVADAVGGGVFGSMLSGITENTVDGIKGWVGDKLAAVGDWGMEQVDSATRAVKTARWLPVARRALDMEGELTKPNLDSLMRRMNQESGFNPRAVNDWDSNAKRGTPSKGLMQVIGPTFRAYARPGFDENIFDPLSNILASIRYTRATYGSLKRGWDRPGGYADGGLVKPFLHDSGGWHKPGELSVNQTRKPEAVLTNAQWQIMSSLAERNLAAGGGVQIGTVQGYTAEEVAREITREQRKRDSLYVR